MTRRREIAARYDATAADYDERHAADRRSRARAAALDGIQLDATRGARRVLEIGCGTGRLLAQARAPIRIGVDVSAGMLRRATARGLDVVLGDGEALPFRDAAFDAVVAGKGVFRYLRPDRAFTEAARVLAPAGMLAVHQYGNRTWSPWRAARPHPEVWELGSVDELVAPARAAGLDVVAIRLFRSIRIRPFLLEIPAWLDRRAPAQLWSHCVAIFARGA